MSLVRVCAVSKGYAVARAETVQALRDVSCSFAARSWTTITGHSGSGKSTLLSLIAALDRPTSGEIIVDDLVVSHASDVIQARYRKERIGIVFQEYRLFEQLSAWENVALPLVVTGLSAGQRRQKASELLDRVGLGSRLGHLPRQLSGGERQRVALARSLVHDPEIILADEPTSNIDQETAFQVISIFRQLRESGHTLIVVSHDPRLAEAADQILTLDQGRLVS